MDAPARSEHTVVDIVFDDKRLIPTKIERWTDAANPVPATTNAAPNECGATSVIAATYFLRAAASGGGEAFWETKRINAAFSVWVPAARK